MKNKKGFTLLEVLLSVLILSLFIGTILTIFGNVKGSDGKMENKRILTAEASDLIDVIHEAALDYTIDYEEYFNRTRLGYLPTNTGFTSYGNSGFDRNRDLYFCFQRDDLGNGVADYYLGLGRWDNENFGCVNRNSYYYSGKNQKYLEYYFQHYYIYSRYEPSTTLNQVLGNNIYFMGKGPVAINPNTGLDYLYLINGDGTERYYFRRTFITGIDLNNNGGIDGKNEQLYKIQMLKLKGFDAGIRHDFDTRGAYDGFIDTRACDNSQGFYCNGNDVQKGNKLPINADDGWIDITSDKVTVSDMKIEIFPAKDPYLAFMEDEYRIDPYAKISFTMNLYGQKSDDEITISTTLSFKNSYRRFPIMRYTGYLSL